MEGKEGWNRGKEKEGWNRCKEREDGIEERKVGRME